MKTLSSLVILLISLSGFSQNISTHAGGGVGDGLPATSATFFGPSGIAIDASGSLFIADIRNHRIRKIGTNGIISTIAGTGNPGFSGDGGLAVNATLNQPWALHFDGAGNLFILDYGNSRIRKIDSSTGLISTIAGNGNVNGDGGQAVNARLSDPRAFCVDVNGNIYIAEAGLNKVRKIDMAGVISTYAGTGVFGFSGDNGPAISAKLSLSINAVAVDPTGNLYIGDYMRIRKVTPGGTITTICNTSGISAYGGDNGPATNGRLSIAYGLSVDASGNLYIADLNNDRIRKINTSGIITTVAGGGGGADNIAATSALLVRPGFAVCNSSGHLFISELNVHKIRKVDNAGIITTIAGTGLTTTFSGDSGPATNASLSAPENAAIDAQGNTYITDANNFRVRKVDANGTITTFAGGGWSGLNNVPAIDAQFSNPPTGVTVDLSGNVLISVSPHVTKVNASGIITIIAGSGSGFGGDGGPAINAMFDNITDLIVHSDGSIFLADAGNNRVRKINSAGIVSTIAGNGTYGCGPYNGGPATNAAFRLVSGVAADQSGNIYISDRVCNVVVKVDAAGMLTKYAGGMLGFSGDGGPAVNAYLMYPEGISMDSNGTLYIADTQNHRIRKVDASGVITTIAGGVSAMFNGDGIPATQAYLNFPRGVTVNNTGFLLIADTQNNRVRKVYTGQNQTITFGPLAGKIYGAAPFALTATASSGLPVSYASSNASVATITGNVVTITGVGTTYITASQNGNLSYSPAATVTQALVVTKANQTISFPALSGTCVNSSFTLTATSTSGLPVNYVSSNPSVASISGNIVTGVSPGSVTITSSQAGNSNYNLAASVPQTLSVGANTAITAHPSSSGQTVCQNAPASALTVTASGSGTVTYQWYSNAINSNVGGTIITGATSSNWTPPSNSPGTSYYYATATSNCGTVTSSVSGGVTINASTVITTQPSAASQVLCLNSAPTTLSVSATGTAPLTYQWLSNTTNSNSGGSVINGATGVSFTPPTDALGFTYYYSTATGGCGSATSSVSGSVTVNVAPTINSHPSSVTQSICLNGTATSLSVAASGGALGFQWYNNTTPANTGGISIGGATGSSYTPPANLSGTTYYYVTVSNNCGSVASSVSGVVTINPVPTVSADNKGVCSGSSVNLTGTPAGGTWSGTGVSGSTFFSTGLPTGGYTVTYSYSNIQGCSASANATVNVSHGPVISSFSGNPPGVCPGNTYTYSVSASGASLSYSWTYPSGWSPNANLGSSIQLQVPSFNPNYGAVRVTVTSNGCTAQDGITTFPGSCGSFMMANNVYPNPANTELILEMSSAEEKDRPVTLYSENGTVVKSSRLKKGRKQLTLDTSGLKNGYYLLEIKHKNGTTELQRVLIVH